MEVFENKISFAGYQATSPQRPLPGPALDVALNSIAAVLAEIQIHLAEVRRADGRVANGSVTLDSLDAGVRKALALERKVLLTELDSSVLASRSDAELGVAGDLLMTALRVAQAIVAQRPYASQAAAQAGQADDSVMSPLRVEEALAEKRGFASKVEAEAGDAENRVMSPLRVFEAIRVLRRGYSATATLSWGPLAAGTSALQNFAVVGARPADRVALAVPASGIPAGLFPTAWVSGDGVISLRITNSAAVALTPPEGVYGVTAVRF